MKKIIAASAIALIAGTSAAFAAQPMIEQSPAQVAAEQQAAVGSLVTVESTDIVGKPMTKTYRVGPNNTFKLVDYQQRLDSAH
ncbi:hypothetical protein FJU08_09160 [Martelella alba]|uniref:Uncharacterized protein n=1 Tax=Martelella alba TaxID=2590451 RepID=A0A506UBR5_9HYPH|nr:hypothetical protein [Martelella alba]TPW30836.1 hypothetical protein FJU08_09160 [Martelella alba]